MKWNISEFLPPKLEKYFSTIIADYILKVNAFKQEFINDDNETL